MARPRKIVALQTGNLTRATKDRRAYEEKLARADRAGIQKVPRADLIDAIAVREYKRVLKALLKLDLIGDLDRSNLIIYCNAYSGYVRACAVMKSESFRPIVVSASGEKPSPWYAIRDQERKAMDAAGKALGMTISSRLTAAAKKADDEEAELRKVFGDI